MAKSHLRLVTPATVKRTVVPKRTPRRLPNAKLRSREYLTPSEVEDLMAAAKRNRWGHRDATMVLVCQSAFKFDPRSASNFDPFWRRVLAVALAPSELVGVAETA